MLIRVLPALPNPNILFTLTLPDPVHDSDRKPCPNAWLMQLSQIEALQEEGFGIDVPKDIHALDKAAWHTALLSEVVFDLITRTVQCTFIDGSQVTWPIPHYGGEMSCLAALEGVVEDVHGASREHERYRYAELRGQESSYHAGSGSLPPSLGTSGPMKAHKRQKSLFSSIVAAFKGALSDNSSRNPTLPVSLPPLKIPTTPCHSRSSSTFSRTQRSPPTSPVNEHHPSALAFQLRVRPREPIPLPSYARQRSSTERLRHRARSTLVDIVRRHVFPMFSATGSPSFAELSSAPEVLAQEYSYPPGLYPAWMGRSLLRKTEERMREMISEASAHGFGTLGLPVSGDSQPSVTLREVDDEDDDTTASTAASTTTVSTDTDGSSVHTPTDSPVRSPFVPAIVSHQGGASLSPITVKAPAQVPRSPSPPSPMFDFDLSTYHALTTFRSRLLSILARLGSSPRQVCNASHYGSDLTILEIKSRRRAWSCRDYVGGARMSLIGLATPFRSSQLARCEPVTEETLARMQAQAAREPARSNASFNGNRSLVGLSDLSEEFGVKVTTKEMDARLFPVCEEDEDEDDELQLSMLGSGHKPHYGMDEYIEHESWRGIDEFDLESGLLVFPRPEPPPALVSDPGPNLYSHLHPMIRSRTQSMRRERTPPLHECGEGALSSNSLLCQPLNVKVPVPVMLNRGDSLDDDDVRSAEFTLSMDLPHPRRGWLGEDVDGVPSR